MIAAALIGAAGSILGNVLQRNAQKEAYRRQQESLRREKADNAAWYNRRYYEDATQRADTQRLLTRARETLRASNRAAMGRNAVMGGTNAEAAAAKEANNQAYADMVSQAAAAAETRKDQVEDAYLKQEQTLSGAQRTLDNTNDQANAEAIGNMATQVGQLAAIAVQNTPAKPNATSQPSTAAAGTQVNTKPGSIISSEPAQVAAQQMQEGYAGLNQMVSNSYRNPLRNTTTVRNMESRWGNLFG